MARTPILNLRLSAWLRQQASEKARQQGLTLSQLIRFFLVRYIRGEVSVNLDTQELERMMANLDERIELIGLSEEEAYGRKKPHPPA